MTTFKSLCLASAAGALVALGSPSAGAVPAAPAVAVACAASGPCAVIPAAVAAAAIIVPELPKLKCKAKGLKIRCVRR